MQTLVQGRVRVVDLDDPRAVRELATTTWSPADPILIGVTGGLRAEHERVLDRLTTTLVPLDAAADRRVVGVLDPGLAAAGLVESVQLQPAATWTLDGLLRLVSEAGSVETGMVAESLAYSTLLAGREFAAWRGGRVPRPVRETTEGLVLMSRDADLLFVRLDDPARRNALSAALRAALVEALDLPRYDDTVTRVELSGAGPSFSSGGDLDEFGTVLDPPFGHAVRLEASPGLAVHRIADRVVARVHGRCIGAGVEIPAFAGRVVASRGTTFELPEITMGLIPGAGGTVSLTRRIGRWRTAYLCLSGARLDAGLALEWGLVDAVE